MITLIPTEQAIAEAGDPAAYCVPVGDDLLVADPARRVPVSFESDGLRIAGHLYPPSGAEEERAAGLVMCGPFSSVKEQTLPHYAERLADAGYAVLTFDPRTFGESEGSPRFHHDPNWVISDYVNGVRYLLERDDIDPDRIAVVGVCMGGGYALSAAARDKRIKAVASIAGGYAVGATFQRFMGAQGFADYLRLINELRQRERETGELAYVPTIARSLSDEVPVAAMPNEEAYSYYARTHDDHAPNWSEAITAACLEPYFSYNSVVHAPLVAPAPLLIVHGTNDFALLPEYAQAAYDAAVGPKQLVWIETHNHIELYDHRVYVEQAIQTVIPWLSANVGGSVPVT